MSWKNILFANVNNPYICKTEKEFNRISKKYDVVQIGEFTYLAKERK